MDHFRDSYLTLWMAVDNSRTLRVYRDDHGQLAVTVWNETGTTTFARRLPAQWTPRSAASRSQASSRRLDELCVELGDEGLGTTYRLLFTVENDTQKKSGQYRWIAVPPDAPLHRVRLHPEQGPSFYEAVLGPYDDFVEVLAEAEGSWTRPYIAFRPATSAERQTHPEGG